MTQRTKNHQIFNRIVFFIFIYMMNAQNIGKFIIAAHLAFLNHISCFHCLSNSYVVWFKCFFIFFFYTCQRTIYSFPRRTIKKFITAMFADVLNASLPFKRFVKTSAGTIFCFITSCRNVLEIFGTYCADSFDPLCTTKFIFAIARAIFKRFQSIDRHVAFFATSLTIQIFTSKRFSHATP